MSLKRVAVKTKKKIVAKEPTSAISRWAIVTAYKGALLLMGKYKKRMTSLNRVIEENAPDRINDMKYVRKTGNDILFCRFMYGISAKEYYIFNFAQLSHEGRKTYLTRSNKYPFYKKFNNQSYTGYLNMKTETYRKFKEFYGRDVCCLYDSKDYPRFLEFIEKHPKFIYKPADDYGGHGVEIYDSREFKSTRELFDLIMYNGYCVVEELIQQADPIRSLHPESVNTMRVVAFLKPDGHAEILWAFLRMGMGKSHIDNASSGGLAIKIDKHTGISYDAARDYAGDIVIAHPDTGVKLIGFQVPEWDKLLEMVDKLANVMPEVRLVGWDLAYSDKGWVFVEGNSRPQTVAAQLTKYTGNLHLYQEMEALYDAARAEEKEDDDDEE